MQVAITGATGFIGRYIVRHLTSLGHHCRCWHRPESGTQFDVPDTMIDWVAGELDDAQSSLELVHGCDAVVHAALYRTGTEFRGNEGDLLTFAQTNVMGSLRLVEAARSAGVERFIYMATCAVHERILDDRPLDEAHPLWPVTHYGAHKAAVEKFVHSYGYGSGYNICSLRPTGVYGAATPIENSKWFELVRSVTAGDDVACRRGGKEVHAADVAKAVGILLTADGISGEAYSCYDRYVSDCEVAQIAARLSGSKARIEGEVTSPKHQIVTKKLRSLGMKFGGTPLLEQTVEQLALSPRRR